MVPRVFGIEGSHSGISPPRMASITPESQGPDLRDTMLLLGCQSEVVSTI